MKLIVYKDEILKISEKNYKSIQMNLDKQVKCILDADDDSIIDLEYELHEYVQTITNGKKA